MPNVISSSSFRSRSTFSGTLTPFPLFLLLLLLSHTLLSSSSIVLAFYLPGLVPVDYEEGASMQIFAQKLTSNANKVPYDYYSVPLCKPDSHSASKARKGLNLGQILVGERAHPTSHELHMLSETTCNVLCTETLTEKDAKVLQQRIEDKYKVRLTLDNMPVIMNMLGSASHTLGYPLGYIDKDAGLAYVYNHLRYTIHYHKPFFAFTDKMSADNEPVYRVVGFSADPMSVAHQFKKSSSGQDPPTLTTCPVLESAQGQVVEPGANVTFTYDVTFKASDLEWATRWDPLLTVRPEHKQIQWFAVLNSSLLGIFLTALLALIMLRTVHRDFAKYNATSTAIYEDPDVEETMQDLAGWKLLRGDIFRRPPHIGLLSVLCGTGAQITTSISCLLIIAVLGFIVPGHRGALLTSLLLLWVLASSVCGYVAGRLYKIGSGENWVLVAFYASFAFPSVIFTFFFLMNLILWALGSISVVPFITILLLLFLWLGISVPLVFLGFFAGFRQKPYDFPVRMNQIPRKIPEQSFFVNRAMFVLSGILPFGVICIELVFILDSFWQNELYYAFGFLFLVYVLFCITSAETSIIVVYIKLVHEDYRWWWQSFFASASSALYAFGFILIYIISQTELERSHIISDILCIGYTTIFCIMIALVTGCIGFFAAFWFVLKIFSAVRVD